MTIYALLYDSLRKTSLVAAILVSSYKSIE